MTDEDSFTGRVRRYARVDGDGGWRRGWSASAIRSYEKP
jgi:hypothetical protein